MTVPLKTVESSSDLAALMHDLGRRAKEAAHALALAPTRQKDEALAAMAEACRARRNDILKANAQDLADAKASGVSAAFLDRLALNEQRLAAMAGCDFYFFACLSWLVAGERQINAERGAIIGFAFHSYMSIGLFHNAVNH